MLWSLASGRGKARMRLECEVRRGRYRVFAVEEGARWLVLPPGAGPEAEEEGLTREEALRAAVLAGFSLRAAQRAVRKAQLGGGPQGP
jgi:hypothetical protein